MQAQACIKLFKTDWNRLDWEKAKGHILRSDGDKFVCADYGKWLNSKEGCHRST